MVAGWGTSHHEQTMTKLARHQPLDGRFTDRQKGPMSLSEASTDPPLTHVTRERHWTMTFIWRWIEGPREVHIGHWNYLDDLLFIFSSIQTAGSLTE
jgi:hypothetical protein